MVSSVSGIGSFASSIFQIQSSTETAQTSQAKSFDELVGNGSLKISEDSSSTGITAMGGPSESSESSSSSSSSASANSEMDLNNDGQVTADEVIRYMQMQMMDEMSDQMSSEDGSTEMNQQSQNSMNIDDFKNQQAARAYQNSEKLLSSITDMIAGSFIG